MNEKKKMNYHTDLKEPILLDQAVVDTKTETETLMVEREYGWYKLSPTRFACVHKNEANLISREPAVRLKEGQPVMVSCTCDEFTDGKLCQHLIAFERLKVRPKTPAPDWFVGYLENACGWEHRKGELVPGEKAIDFDKLLKEEESRQTSEVIPPDPELDIGVDEEKPAKPKKKHVCACGEEFPDIDALLRHIETCATAKEIRESAGVDDGEVDPDDSNAPVPEPEKKPNVPEPKPKVPEPKPTPAPKPAVPNSKTSLIDTIKKYVGADVLEIFGDTGSGKSKFALEIAREATSTGLKVFYLDSERNLADDDVKMLDKGYKYTPVLKEIDTTIQKLPAVDIVIIDSIGFPILTAYARYSMKQKGDALLEMIAMFGDLKQWAYKNNGLVIVVNQPESSFNKEPGHILRPFGDKSQFAAKEIWWMKMMKRADRTPDRHTEILITSFRGRTLGFGDKLYTMNIKSDGVEFVSMR